MKIDIVTPYGNNRFDLGVNEVTKLIQKAYEFSEKGSEEEQKTGGIAESLQEAVAEAWGVVADKEKEKVGYKENVVETVNTDVQKTRRKSRNESLFGEGWSNTLSQPQKSITEEQRDFSRQMEGYKGFLYVKCPDCGKVRGFCAKENIKETKCSCGKTIPLINLKPMYVKCYCGGKYRYFTNMDEDSFEYNCIGCGEEVSIRINTRGTAYVTDRKCLGVTTMVLLEIS